MEQLCSSSLTQGDVCVTCGDEGFVNAFVYCVKCLEVPIHRYCLNVIPKTYNELVIWRCDGCELKLSQKKESAKSGHVKATTCKKKQKNSGHVKTIHHRKKHKERDMASILAGSKEVIRKENITYPEVECIDGRERVIAEHILKKSRTKRKRISAFEAAKKTEDKLLYGLMVDSIKVYGKAITSTERNLKIKKSVVYSSEEQVDESQPSKPSCENEKLEPDLSFMEKESDKSIHPECQPETNHNVPQPVEFEPYEQEIYHRYAQPVRDPVWRGSFDICGNDYQPFEGIFAHLSSKACEKVFNEANMMPSLLNIEIHPKNYLWPNSFKEREPSDDKIALYFFPGHPVNEKAFDRLVLDMIDKELAMRLATVNAELLIFTSLDLPQIFWRFNGKYYLWGVFRAKRNKPTLVSLSGNDQTVSNSGDQCGPSKDPPSKEIDVKKLSSMKTLDAHSPRSPLSSNGENGVDMDRDSGD